MNVGLINTSHEGFVSGGALYNRQLSSALERLGIHVHPMTDFSASRFDAWLVDSLFLNQGHGIPPSLIEQAVLLIHEVPKRLLDTQGRPLEAAARARLRVLATGPETVEQMMRLHQIDARHIALARPGIEENWQIKSTCRSTLRSLLMIANPIPGKGYEQLLRLLPVLEAHQATLCCIGDPGIDAGFAEQLRQTLAAEDPQGLITLCAPVSRAALNRALCQADLLISPSRAETYGMAVYEAVCTGLPVLMFQTGGWQEFQAAGLVRSVETDDPAGFAAALDALLSTPPSMPPRRPSPRSWQDTATVCRKLLERVPGDGS